MGQAFQKFTLRTDMETLCHLPATIFTIRLETHVTRVDDIRFGNIIL